MQNIVVLLSLTFVMFLSVTWCKNTTKSVVEWKVSFKSANSSWTSLASSDTGEHLVASSYDSLYFSMDSGKNWHQAKSPPQQYGWNSVTISNTGQYAYAVVIYGGIYMSEDYGKNWKPINAPTPKYWFSIACSSSGQYVYATDFMGGIWNSKDFGVNWSMTSLPAFGNWYDLCCSQNGQYVVTVQTSNGYIFFSGDAGQTWEQAAAPQASWAGVACSHDGHNITSIVAGGKIHISTDSGASWNVAAKSPSLQWGAIAGDATGQKLLAAAVISNDTTSDATQSGVIYQSLDYGNTWMETSGPTGVSMWSALASDNTGLVLAASSYGGQLYYSICDTVN